jgi:hypothetical protein
MTQLHTLDYAVKGNQFLTFIGFEYNHKISSLDMTNSWTTLIPFQNKIHVCYLLLSAVTKHLRDYQLERKEDFWAHIFRGFSSWSFLSGFIVWQNIMDGSMMWMGAPQLMAARKNRRKERWQGQDKPVHAGPSDQWHPTKPHQIVFTISQ